MRILKKIWEIYYYKLRWHQTEIICEVPESAPLPPEASKILEQAADALAKAGFAYALSWGTALGFYRNGGFIPHDNDIDLDVVDCDNPEGIVAAMEQAGFKLCQRISYRGKVQQLIFIGPFKVVVDITFWTSRGRDLVCYAEPGYTEKLPRKFAKREQVNFQGKQYPLPSPAGDYLAAVYGQSWRTPKKIKGDWKDDCQILHKQFDPGLWLLHHVYPLYANKIKKNQESG